MSWDLDSDGSAERFLYCEIDAKMQMDGKEIFRRAVRAMVDSATKSMAHAGVTADDIALVVPHQANIRIISAAVRPPRPVELDRTAIVLDHTGNTSSASVPLALADALDARPRQGRRPRPVRRLRRRHDRGERHHPLVVERRGAHRDATRPPTDRSDAGRVVLVTGGSRGIGLATAQRFAAHGDRVAVTYNSTHPTRGPLRASSATSRRATDVDAAFDAVEAEFGGTVEVLVSNAGITNDGLLLRMSEDDFTSVIDANLTAAYRVTKRAARGMLKARTGRIILMSSVVALLGQAGQANYAASKAGLVGLARSLARELGSRSITVNVIAPGPVATDMTAALSATTCSRR